MMQPHFDPNQIFLDPEVLEHLQEEVERPVNDLLELQEVITALSGKAGRRMAKIRDHMMHCGTCLNKQIANGMLPPIEEYYEAGPMMGAGRLPKLHHMMN